MIFVKPYKMRKHVDAGFVTSTVFCILSPPFFLLTLGTSASVLCNHHCHLNGSFET